MKKLLHVTFLLLILLIIFPQKIFASSNFTTDTTVTYSVKESGVTQAEFAITLTNTSENVYADSYKLQLGLSDITNLTASDPLGKIKTKLEKADGNYNVVFYLNKKSLGKGQKATFNVKFETKSIATKSGESWEINIPGISNPDVFQTFNTNIKVPDSFGAPSYIKPENKTLNFTKKDLQKSGVSIAFGKSRNYDFKLSYHLKNPNLFPANSKIALPMDTNYQKISINSIVPKPKKVYTDFDGNWIAEYPLGATKEQDVTVKGVVQIQLNPKSSLLTVEQKQTYTSATKYWPTDDEAIQSLAKRLKTPRKIYEYVSNTLKYDFTRVTKNKPRLGGAEALKNTTSAVCLEFTDLFITLARNAGIPAREVNGFAYTQSDPDRPLSLIADVLHAWPEYYDFDRKSWIMIDPTWAATTSGIDYFEMLDFDHFAFAIKGKRDDLPIPAGGYKTPPNTASKDIEINPTNNTINLEQKNTINTSLSKKYIAGLPIKIKVNITNNGTSATPIQSFQVSSRNLRPAMQESILSSIPPFGTETVEIYFDNKDFLTNKQESFTIFFANKKQTQTIQIVPFYKYFE